MNPIFEAAAEIQEFLLGAGWRFCFIGGLAVQRWGEPRVTIDVDVTLLTGFGGEDRFVDQLLARFAGRLPDAREFALRYRVLLLESGNGIPLDVSLGAMPFEERAVARASPYPIDNARALTTCSAEDLVVLKAFAARDRDWADIEGIVARQAGRLDEAQIWREMRPLIELRRLPEIEEKLRRLLSRR